MGHKLLPGRGVPSYDSLAAFPEGAHGDLAVARDTDTLYEYTGTTWTAIASTSSVIAVSDTNSIDLTNTAGTLSADLVTQNTNSVTLSVDSSGLKADLSYVDTNGIDLDVGASGLSATLVYTDTSSIDLGVGASGLTADVNVSATGVASTGTWAATTLIKDDGLFVEVPESGVLNSVLTGYAAASGTVAATDSVLEAFGKVGYHISQHEPAQLVTVASSGAMFTSIQSAIDSITDAASDKPYIVEIAPGVYTEDVTLKDWVFIQNGISGAVIIAGTVTATGLIGTSGIRGVTLQFTPTAPDQVALEIEGGIFYLVDADIYLLGAADYATTGVKGTSGTAFTVFNSTVWDRRTGDITNNLTAWQFLGSGTFGIFNASTSARCSYTAGTHCLFKCDATGSFTASGGAAIYASSSASTAEVRGWCLSETSTSPRIVSGHQIRLQGVSGGTAYGAHLDSSSNSGSFQFVNTAVFIDGFTDEYSCSSAVTDSLRFFLTALNKDLESTGAGANIVTPHDLDQSGFVSWQGTGNYYSFNPATREFTLLRACTGMIHAAPIIVPGNQTITLDADYTGYFIEADSDGNILATTVPVFDQDILLFSIYSDGTNYAVTKQTHPVAFPSAVADYAHNAFGSSLDNESDGVLTLLSDTGRTVQMVGDTTYRDHGLDTDVADSGGAAISLFFMYEGASGTTFYSAPLTAIPGVVASGTALVNGTNGRYVNYRVGVMPSSNLSDDVAEQIAQYVIVAGSVQHTNATAAANAIAANSVTAFPVAAVRGLEVINLGFVTIQIDGAGGGTITSVTPAKQVFGVNFASGSTTSAGSVTLDTTNFDKNLSASDTTVQLALNTLDEFNALPSNATNTSGSPDLTNKTAFASAASGTTATFTFDARGAIEFLVDVNTDGGMTIACDYKSTIVNALSDPSSLFLATDAGTGLYISKSANSAEVSIKNNMGATKTIGVLAVRSPITAATAWS